MCSIGFTDGLLFYYFGNVDQIAHMMWRARDPGHPAYDPAVDPKYADVIDELYVGLDRIVGDTLDAHRRRRNAHRAVRPRLHLVAAIVPPQHLAEAGGVS